MIVSFFIKENCININKLHKGGYLHISTRQHRARAILYMKIGTARAADKKWGRHWLGLLHFTSQTRKYFMCTYV